MERKYILTDAMSLKEICSAIYEADIKYKRIVGREAIKKFIESNTDQITSKIRRESYSYGLSLITGYQFPTVGSKEGIVDIARGGAVINVGIANPNRVDTNDLSNWDNGKLELELRILYINQ
ncbi:MAG: hypothetical protein K2I99_04765 [Bacteroidaceae bacterium]|nr:hypothetical protein [Bacteroidaceae bacterium]